MLQLLQCCAVIAEDCMARGLDWEAEHIGAVRLHHVVLDWEALLSHELSEWVFLVGADGADVVLRVPRVDARSRVDQLRHGTAGLDRGDGCGWVDA